MKKISVLPVLILALSLFLNACGTSTSGGKEAADKGNQTVTIAAVDYEPYDGVLQFVQKRLKEQGIDLQIKYFTDVVIPNEALNNKEVDLNYFQNNGYLRAANASNNTELTPVAYTFDQIFGAYSKKYKSIEDLPDGSVITIPGDPGNSARSLKLLEQHGLIKLKEGAGFDASQRDIIENNHNYKFVEIDQMMLPKAYEDADLIAIMGGYALQAGLKPAKDALIKEKINGHDYTSVLVARPDNKDDELIQKVAKAFEASEVKQFVLENYSDVAVWK
ncbi:MAG TPA: MetQ/NlpA family ABC transporter substrate-binding protein [Bacillus sp. (in: firmicutes)]|nr:MetQ/NlpA family ABC transporter substrate-binding protein [Bacillus sp. (in: firmicutes)]